MDTATKGTGKSVEPGVVIPHDIPSAVSTAPPAVGTPVVLKNHRTEAFTPFEEVWIMFSEFRITVPEGPETRLNPTPVDFIVVVLFVAPGEDAADPITGKPTVPVAAGMVAVKLELPVLAVVRVVVPVELPLRTTLPATLMFPAPSSSVLFMVEVFTVLLPVSSMLRPTLAAAEL